MSDGDELRILEALEAGVRSGSVGASIDTIVRRVEQALERQPDDVLA